MALPKDLVTASATPLILSILDHGDSYGYDIIQKVREYSGGELEWAEGMLYPILHRLESRQFIESYWDTAATGRKRKYYRISKLGTAELQEQRANWHKLSRILDKVKEAK